MSSSIRIKYTQSGTPLLFQVTATRDGRTLLSTNFRARDEKHLRGMVAHDLLHVLAGIGFSRPEEKDLKAQAKLIGVDELKRIERTTEKLMKGKNIILQEA